ncbi:hypothetical protein ACFQL1_02665 [Halomicroarcula sp. GCM10025709]|uniref:hypothetical protein n=1 Tax=Haloarcula TaxID=2237 RepID=UPI0024C36ABD|nr:hypothetical protein [Halomicroarcula sp. YJ-61-S]
MVGGERTRRAVLAGIGGLTLAGVAEAVSNPRSDVAFDWPWGDDQASVGQTPTPEPQGTPVTPVPTAGTAEPGGCRSAFESGFERPLDDRFRSSGFSVERTTEYARSGEHGVLLRARSSDFESKLRSQARFCGDVTAEVAGRYVVAGGGGANFTLALVDPDSFAKLAVGPMQSGNAVAVQEWTGQGGSVTGWASLPRTVGTDWSSLALSVSAGTVTATVDGTSTTYETTDDWTDRPVRLQLRTKTTTTGSDVAAAFDDLRVRTG